MRTHCRYDSVVGSPVHEDGSGAFLRLFSFVEIEIIGDGSFDDAIHRKKDSRYMVRRHDHEALQRFEGLLGADWTGVHGSKDVDEAFGRFGEILEHVLLQEIPTSRW